MTTVFVTERLHSPVDVWTVTVSNLSVSFRLYIGYSAYRPLASHSILIGYRNYVANIVNAVLNVPLLSWY